MIPEIKRQNARARSNSDHAAQLIGDPVIGIGAAIRRGLVASNNRFVEPKAERTFGIDGRVDISERAQTALVAHIKGGIISDIKILVPTKPTVQIQQKNTLPRALNANSRLDAHYRRIRHRRRDRKSTRL